MGADQPQSANLAQHQIANWHASMCPLCPRNTLGQWTRSGWGHVRARATFGQDCREGESGQGRHSPRRSYRFGPTRLMGIMPNSGRAPNVSLLERVPCLTTSSTRAAVPVGGPASKTVPVHVRRGGAFWRLGDTSGGPCPKLVPLQRWSLCTSVGALETRQG